MADPVWVRSGTGAYAGGGTPSFTVTADAAGDIVVFQILEKQANPSGMSFQATSANIESLAGVVDTMTLLGSVSIATPLYQYAYVGRAIAAGTVTVVFGTVDESWSQLHLFSGVNIGTTLADIVENSTAGTVNTAGWTTSTSIADVGVTTLGAGRCAVNLIAVADDNALGSFTGETGGDWVLRASFASTDSSDGGIGLQTAAMSAAGTVNGGTYTMASDPWSVIGFAFKPLDSFVPRNSAINHQNPGVLCKAHDLVRRWKRHGNGIFLPDTITV